MVTINLKGIADEDFTKIREDLVGCRAYIENDIILNKSNDEEPKYSIILNAPADSESGYKCVDVDVLVEMCTLVEHEKC